VGVFSVGLGGVVEFSGELSGCEATLVTLPYRQSRKVALFHHNGDAVGNEEQVFKLVLMLRPL